jgi:uncharacterized Zn finger protein (UPF0148 family)
MPHCSQCGTEVSEDDIFCPKCGHELDERFTAAGDDQGGVEDDPLEDESEPTVQPQEGASASPPEDKPNAESEKDPLTSEITGNRMSRRKQLALVGGGLVVAAGGVGAMAVLGGGGKPQHQLIGADTSWESDRTDGQGETIVTASITLPKGRYAWRSLSPRTTVEVVLDVDVENGPIDVLTMDDGEYDRYRDREKDAEYLRGLSELQTNGTRLEATVSDDYKIVVDNTGVYGASPSGAASIDLTLTARI